MRAKADERMEILDKGVHLGWAEIVNGQWGLAPVQLSLGAHILTAKYRDITSSPWQIEVEPPTDEEVFDGVSREVQLIKNMVRPFYEGDAEYVQINGYVGCTTGDYGGVPSRPECLRVFTFTCSHVPTKVWPSRLYTQ